MRYTSSRSYAPRFGMRSTRFCFVFVNAVMRYMLNTSIIWAEEVVLGLVPWLAMSGLFLAIPGAMPQQSR